MIRYKSKAASLLFSFLLLFGLLASSSCGTVGKKNNKTTDLPTKTVTEPEETGQTVSETHETDAEGGWFEIAGDYKFYTNGSEASIAAFSGSEKELVLPGDLKGIPVVSIGWSAFSENKTIEKITVPESVWVIGISAFSECTSLKEIVLPSSLTKIDINSFSGCTALTEINIPENVEEIGISAFGKCTSLENVFCDEKNRFFCSIDGVLYSKDKTELKVYPAGKKDETYIIDQNTVSIADRAFEGNVHIKTVDLKNTAAIGNYSFKDCTSLLDLIFTEGIEYDVAGGAFDNTAYQAAVDESAPPDESDLS